MKKINLKRIGAVAVAAAFPFVLEAQRVIVKEYDSLRIEIEELDNAINSEFDDYAPVITADKSVMFFTSRRPFTEKEQKRNRQGSENIYESIFDEDSGEWLEAEALKPPINDPKRFNSNIAVSNDGQRLLVYMDDGYGYGDIYESYLVGNKWSDPQSIGETINSEDHESSASIAPDGRTIYFVSDRKGGKGGRDIWRATKDSDGNWGEAENLGDVINTKKNEEGVFIHPDGKTLYFSSQGHNSKGGYDVFKSIMQDDGSWSKPINLGEPINTEGDDLFFVVSADGKTGYYASNRGGKVKNIFEIRFFPLEKSKDEGPKLTVFKGKIFDEKTEAPLGATIVVVDNEKDEVIGTYASNSETGKYLISLPAGKNYGINISKEGYLFSSHSFDLTNDSVSEYKEVKQDIALKKLEVGSRVVLKNIFFDYDKATLRPESKTELKRLKEVLDTNPSMSLEIGGHTDSRGSAEYNARLSKNRAKSVVDYLIEQGISSERLTYKGYGMTDPVATNDTEEGRQENRRVEFKVMKK